MKIIMGKNDEKKMYYYKATAFILIFFVSISLLVIRESLAANYPLEIIQPQEGLDTKNRFYKAYPGLEYNVRTAIIGGAYPFTHELIIAPSGMTINVSTGEITWPEPLETGSPHSVTVRVTDMEEKEALVSWTITVTTNGFKFLDAVSGKTVAQGGTGTITNPWKSIADMYEGKDYASKYKDSYAYNFLYFKTGKYPIDAYLQSTYELPLTSMKPVVWLAYPGETPTLDMGLGWLEIDNVHNVYFDGFIVNNITNGKRRAIRVGSGNNNATFRNNIFHNLTALSGSYNQACIMIAAAGVGSYWAFQDNTFYDIRHGYGILGYRAKKVLIEDNTLHDFSDPLAEGSSHAIGLKVSTVEWHVRRNYLYNISGNGLWCFCSDVYGSYKDIDISYNLVINNGGNSISINSDGYKIGGIINVYRNTFIGSAVFRCPTKDNGPYNVYSNVIVNDTDFKDHVRCRDYDNTNTYPNPLTLTDNLTGYSAAGITDAKGNLTPAYVEDHRNIRGYQIPIRSPATLIKEE